QQAAQAVCALLGPQVKHIFQNGLFEVYQGKIEDDKFITMDRIHVGVPTEEIHFVPVIAGSSNIVKIVVGVILIVVGIVLYEYGGQVLAQWVVGLLMAGASTGLGGIAGLLAPGPTTQGPQGSSV